MQARKSTPEFFSFSGVIGFSIVVVVVFFLTSSTSTSFSLPNNSADRKALEIPAAVTAAAGAMLASPLAAYAEVTPSLKNLINSVIAGGVVLVAIVGAVTAVSGFDPVTRK